MGELRHHRECPACNGSGTLPGRPWCYDCFGSGDLDRAATTADLVALPPAEREARLVALLRAVPDEAVQAVDTAKVMRPWWARFRTTLACDRVAAVDYDNGQGQDAEGWYYRRDDEARWDGPDATEQMARENADAALLADGWVLAGGVTP